MVVCPEPLAAKVGIEVLKRGGNAVDAAVAAAYVQGVVNPQACGIGGNAQLSVFMAGERKPTFVGCPVKTGSKADPMVLEYIPGPNPKLVKGDETTHGYKSITTPTFVRDTAKALELWGTMELAELLRPVIDLCEKGILVYPYIAKLFKEYPSNRLSSNAECARIYLKDGRPYEVGEKLVQPDYGRTLRKISKDGPESFFDGEIAESIVADFEKNGALVTAKDLAETEPRVYEPLESTYRDCTIYENVPPSTGPVKLMVTSILENFDIPGLGWNTPGYLYVLSRAIQIATYERSEYLDADPDYYPEVLKDLRPLLSKEHAKEVARMIVDMPNIRYPGYRVENLARAFDGRGETTYLGVVDADGNAVSLKHSIGTSSGVVTPGLGFMYNNHSTIESTLDPRPNRRESFRPRLAPGGIGQDPSMVFKDGEPHLIGGSPGGQNGAMGWLQVLMNILEFKMRPQAAVSVPRIVSDKSGVVVIESSFPFPYPIEDLREMGSLIEVSDMIYRIGRISVIQRDPKTGELVGGTDPRAGGGLGYLP